MEGSSLRRGSGARRGRMRAVDALTLAAVGLVVLLVSLPRLRDLALRENESDALWLVSRLAELCVDEPAADIARLVERSPTLARQLDDAEFLDQGRVLRRHGYLFDLTGRAGEASLRAWPWLVGRTGRVALVWTPSTGLLGSGNDEGRWSGAGSPPPVGAAVAAGWRAVRPR